MFSNVNDLKNVNYRLSNSDVEVFKPSRIKIAQEAICTMKATGKKVTIVCHAREEVTAIAVVPEGFNTIADFGSNLNKTSCFNSAVIAKLIGGVTARWNLTGETYEGTDDFEGVILHVIKKVEEKEETEEEIEDTAEDESSSPSQAEESHFENA